MTGHRGLNVALGIALVCGLVAGVTYGRYAHEWLRSPAKISKCVSSASKKLRKPAVASGIEPHDTPDGTTVYLTPAEDSAVRCARGISSETASRFAAAFSEQEPELRALELLKILREVPPGPDNDRAAHTVYRLADGAMQALPQLPETKAATAELDELYACRFDTKMPCPSRPRLPWLVWATGVPAALALLFALIVGSPRAVRRLGAWIRARREAARLKKDAVAAAAKERAKASAAPVGAPAAGAAAGEVGTPRKRKKPSPRPPAEEAPGDPE